MRSLSDLNTSSAQQLEFTDNRDQTVIWVKVNDLVLEETSTASEVTVKHAYDIKEIIQPQLTNIIYEINVPSPLTVSWDNFPATLTLIQQGTVYTIMGITTIDEWLAIRNGTITAPDDYQGNFTYEVDLKYTDTTGQQTLHWEVNEYLPVSLFEGEFVFDATVGVAYGFNSEMYVFAGIEADPYVVEINPAEFNTNITFISSVNVIRSAQSNISTEITIDARPDVVIEQYQIYDPDAFTLTLPFTDNPQQIDVYGDFFAFNSDNSAALNIGLVKVNNVSDGQYSYQLQNPDFTDAAGDRFGEQISMNSLYTAVSATGEDFENDTFPPNRGVVHIFDQTGDLVRTLQSPEGINYPYETLFGTSIDLDTFNTNKILVCDSYYIETSRRGKAYLINATTGSVISTFVSNNTQTTFADPGYNFAFDGVVCKDRVVIANAQSETFEIYDTNGNYINNGAMRTDRKNCISIDENNFVVTTTNGLDLYDLNGNLVRSMSAPNFNPNTVSMNNNYIIAGDDTVLADDGNRMGKAVIFDRNTGIVLQIMTPDRVPGEVDRFGFSVFASQNCVIVTNKETFRLIVYKE